MDGATLRSALFSRLPTEGGRETTRPARSRRRRKRAQAGQRATQVRGNKPSQLNVICCCKTTFSFSSFSQTRIPVEHCCEKHGKGHGAVCVTIDLLQLLVHADSLVKNT
jgi:hypothetical protein